MIVNGKTCQKIPSHPVRNHKDPPDYLLSRVSFLLVNENDTGSSGYPTVSIGSIQDRTFFRAARGSRKGD